MSGVPPYHSLAAAAAAIKARAISPVDLTRIYLDRIAKLQPRFHAYVTVCTERALADARAAERDLMAGNWRGPLHGIPLGLKDVIETRGIRTTGHSRVLLNNIPATDAAVVQRLVDAAAVLLGKLATHEFALGGPSADLPWPPARNPWNAEHFTGGSSSGPAAAVAGGLALGAIASDTSGSGRSPAAFCGITGFKPTFGTVDIRGVLPVAPSLDTVSVMAWTVEDCRLLYEAIRNPTAGARAHRLSQPGAAFSLKGKRIKVIRHFYREDAPISSENETAIEDALDVLSRLGCRIEEGHLPPLAEWMACGFIILLAEVYETHGAQLKKCPDQYGSAFRNIVGLGSALTADDKRAAEHKRRELIASIDTLMEECDFVVSAVQMGAAPKLIDSSPWTVLDRPSQAMPFSVAGQPAISICCGRSANGLPLGFQLIGRQFGDDEVLSAGQAYQAATDWHQQRPPCWEAMLDRPPFKETVS
jgi:aspartyl-tRNA(Asn)/glutamyl-tRNA(Gln) amidotransferase subunit A